MLKMALHLGFGWLIQAGNRGCNSYSLHLTSWGPSASQLGAPGGEVGVESG